MTAMFGPRGRRGLVIYTDSPRPQKPRESRMSERLEMVSARWARPGLRDNRRRPRTQPKARSCSLSGAKRAFRSGCRPRLPRHPHGSLAPAREPHTPVLPGHTSGLELAPAALGVGAPGGARTGGGRRGACRPCPPASVLPSAQNPSGNAPAPGAAPVPKVLSPPSRPGLGSVPWVTVTGKGKKKRPLGLT